MKNGTRVRVCSYRPGAVLKISGEDALSFIQGQFTQDVKPCEAGACVYGLWLNQKGKVLADSWIFREDPGGSWWVVSEHSPATVISERLEAYLIADDATIEDQTGAWEAVAVIGEDGGKWLVESAGVLPESGRQVSATADRGWIWEGRRGHEKSWEWLRPAGTGATQAAPALAEAEEIAVEALERLRIAAGIPAIPRDVGPEDLPNEAGLEDVAISYSKGCYLGQEVMARLKAMGRVRRKLLRVDGDNAADARMVLPADLFLGEKRVGQLRSAVAEGEGWRGLAMVSLLGLEEGVRLSFSAGGPAVVRVEVPA